MKNSTDQHSKQSNGEPVTFQRISPKSDGSKLFKIDTLDIGAMVNEITNEAKCDISYFQDILAASIVIAARKIGLPKSEEPENIDSFASICIKYIEWALYTGPKMKNHDDSKTQNKKVPEVGLNIARAFHQVSMDLAKNQKNHLKALKCLGESFFELERFRRASEKLEECKEIIEQNHPATESKDILEIKIDVLHLLGRSQYELGNFDTSEDYLTEAVEVLEMDKKMDKKNSKKLDRNLNLNLSAKINKDLSQTLLEFNDFDMALDKAASAIGHLNGEQAMVAKIVRGKIKMSQEDFSGAINDFMDDASVQAKHNNVRVIRSVDMRKEKRKAIESLVSQNKMLEATLISYLGYCHLSIGEMVNAEYWGTEGFNQFKKISKSEEDPTIIEIHFMRGQTLTKTGNFREAQTTLEKGLQIAKDMFRTTPNHPLIAQSYLHLGLLLIEPSSVKDLADARRYLKKAKEMSVDVYSECDRKFFTTPCKKTNEKLLTIFSSRSTILEV